MHASRSRLSLLALLAALGLLLAPAAARAGRPAAKPAAKVTDRSAAAKKGAQTRAINKKAEANWATRVSKNPALAKDKAAEAKFKAASVRAQRQAIARKGGTTTTAAKKKPVKLAKKKGAAKGSKRVAAAGEVEPGPGAEPAEIDQDGDLDLDDDAGDLDDDGEAPQASSEGGLWGKLQRYRAARKTFRALADSNPELADEVTVRSRVRGSWRNGLVTGGGAFMAAAGILTGGTLLAVLGLGAAGVGGAREVINRDAARKELVEELAADDQLEPQEIATFQAAGWL